MKRLCVVFGLIVTPLFMGCGLNQKQVDARIQRYHDKKVEGKFASSESQTKMQESLAALRKEMDATTTDVSGLKARTPTFGADAHGRPIALPPASGAPPSTAPPSYAAPPASASTLPPGARLPPGAPPEEFMLGGLEFAGSCYGLVPPGAKFYFYGPDAYRRCDDMRRAKEAELRWLLRDDTLKLEWTKPLEEAPAGFPIGIFTGQEYDRSRRMWVVKAKYVMAPPGYPSIGMPWGTDPPKK